MSNSNNDLFNYLKPRLIKLITPSVYVFGGILSITIMDWLYEIFDLKDLEGNKEELLETGIRAFTGIVGLIIVVYSVILFYRLIVVLDAYVRYKPKK